MQRSSGGVALAVVVGVECTACAPGAGVRPSAVVPGLAVSLKNNNNFTSRFILSSSMDYAVCTTRQREATSSRYVILLLSFDPLRVRATRDPLHGVNLG